MQAIYLAGGCFWGMEELFRDQPGVIDTEVGYMGGKNDNPTYEHHPGHAEALKVIYDDRIISYDELLDFFFRIHDPTTLNQQGNDIGTSYRSAIFYETAEQKQLAEQAIERIDASGLYDGNATTSLEPYVKFWSAEDEHQDYLQKHPGGYTCHYIRTKS
ncbi:MAG: peptide-methionine (S)-S-oxide reductase MsrA [Candidatus Saccharimonadales bacterium]